MERIWIDSFEINLKSALRNLKSAILVGALLCALCFPAEAQESVKIPRIGVVSGTGNPNEPGSSIKIFRQALQDLGYSGGENILFEYRFTEGNRDRVPEIAPN